jgi:hypothetical protein
LLAELKPCAAAICGPPTEQRDFKALAEDMATVRMPEEFIRDTQIMAARISEASRDRHIMDALEELACYVIARKWTSDMREGLMRPGGLDLSDGKPMSISSDQRAKDILHDVVMRVNQIACREYDIPLLSLRFEPQKGEVSQDKQPQASIISREGHLSESRLCCGSQAPGIRAGPLGSRNTPWITHAYQRPGRDDQASATADPATWRDL